MGMRKNHADKLTGAWAKLSHHDLSGSERKRAWATLEALQRNASDEEQDQAWEQYKEQFEK